MSAVKKAVTTVAVLAVLGGGGYFGYRYFNKDSVPEAEGTVFVQKVSEVNSAAGLDLSGMTLAGVIEAQKTEDVKFDRSKQVKQIFVKAGDEVKKGDDLFSYDIEAMQYEYDTAKIELERLEYEVETKKKELEEKEKLTYRATREELVELEADILSLKSDVATSEYKVKTQKSKNKKMKQSLKNSTVTAPVSGIIKEAADVNNLDELESNILVKISKDDNYIVKGTVSEMSVRMLQKDMPVIIRSRIDDSTWSGVISNIDNKPKSENEDMDMYYDMMGGESASKYSFTVEPENLDGLLLGQHILIEPDMGQGEMESKEGIWLYSDFIFEEDGKSYVWAENSKERMEKREVKIGKTDDLMGDCEIISGLDDDDYIAYPMGDIREGMSATTNYDEADVTGEEDMAFEEDGMMVEEGGMEMMPEGEEGFAEEDLEGEMPEEDAFVDEDTEGPVG